MTVTTTPRRDFVLLQLHPVATHTGHIHRVSHFESVRAADVVAIGPECRDYAVGTVVLVNPLVGQFAGDRLVTPEPTILGSLHEGAIAPSRGRLLVRRVETDERFAGSLLIMPQTVREGLAANQVQIVAAGPSGYCTNKRCERPHVGDGDDRQHPADPLLTVDAWALVRHRSLIEASDTDRLYFVEQDHVEAVFQVED